MLAWTLRSYRFSYTMEFRPRRSALYMPGSNARALEKARNLDADVLIFDLEDAVAPAQKDQAREQVLAALAAGGYGSREVVVRINALDSPWGEDDVRALACSAAAAICLPKAESARQVRTLAARLKDAGSGPELAIWAMAETPRGILAIEEIVFSEPRLEVLVMGTSDLAKELRVPHTEDRAGFHYALGRCVMAARAAGLDVLDGVHLDLEDDAGLEQACEQGRALGFDGKTLIHPRQLDIANRVFRPDAAALDRARRVMTAWREAEAAGQGVVLVDGRLVESLHVEEAQRLLALDAAIDARGPV